MQGPFKRKYYNHRSNFANEIYRHRTNLSNYRREIKKNVGTDPILKWEILKEYKYIKRGINIVIYVWRRNLQ